MAIAQSDSPAEPISEATNILPPKPLAGLTPRALIIGLLLVPVLCAWNIYSDIVAQATEIGSVMSLSIGVVFTLLVLLTVNAALRRFAPRLVLTQAELLYIYVMQAATIGISGVGMMEFLCTQLGNVFYYASPGNGWAKKYQPYLAHWAFPDPSVLHGFYLGHSTFLTADHIRGWLSPILIWSAFLLVLLSVTFCLSALLRRRWVDEERLTFPIVIMPFTLTDNVERGLLFRNKVFWIAFAVAFILENLASFAHIYPGVPFLPMKASDFHLILINASDPSHAMIKSFTSPPWSAIGEMDLAFYPLVIGLTYFLPLDVSCSCWFFFFLRKIEDILATAWGFRDPGVGQGLARFPYIGEQGFGGFLGLAVISLWAARGYFRTVVPNSLGKKAARDDSQEPLPYRWATFGIIAGLAVLLVFELSLGLSLPIGLALLILYLLVVVGYTRIRAEAGLAWAFGPDMTPHQSIISATGTAIGLRGLIGLTMFQWLDLDYRGTVMPNQLEGMKIATSGRLNQRHFSLSIALATIVALAASWFCILFCYYHYGAATGNVNDYRTTIGTSPWQILDGWTGGLTTTVDAPRLIGVAVGVGVTALLTLARTRLLWWPLNPIGYVLSGTFTMVWLWCPIFVGWISKWILLRYGGLRYYRMALPFFIGLILGDYVAGSLWAIYGCISGTQPYRIAPI